MKTTKAISKAISQAKTNLPPLLPIPSPPPPPPPPASLPSSSKPAPPTTSANNKPLSNVRSRLEPLLQTPPFSLATLHLLQRRRLSRDCPALFKSPTVAKKSPTSADKSSNTWTTILPRRTQSNLTRLKASSSRDFINYRLQQLKKSGRCFNCQSKGHRGSSCSSKSRCLLCNKYGHPLKRCPILARDTQPSAAPSTSAPQPPAFNAITPTLTPLPPINNPPCSRSPSFPTLTLTLTLTSSKPSKIPPLQWPTRSSTTLPSTSLRTGRT